MDELSDEQAHQVYTWVDKHALSRPKRNIARDFADGVCVAEIMKFYFPQFVELHNYVAAFSQKQKIENWLTLKQKVFRRLNLDVDPKELSDISNAVPGAIEKLLLALMHKIPLVQHKLSSQRSASESATPAAAAASAAAGRSASAADARPASARIRAADGVTPSSSRGLPPTTVPGAVSQPDSRESMAKDNEISHLRDSVRLLTAKIKQLEELLKLRDTKIRDLQERLVQASS
jgi:hypothetical protein